MIFKQIISKAMFCFFNTELQIPYINIEMPTATTMGSHILYTLSSVIKHYAVSA